MAPWLVNIYTEGMVRVFNARMRGRGLCLINSDER